MSTKTAQLFITILFYLPSMHFMNLLHVSHKLPTLRTRMHMVSTSAAEVVNLNTIRDPYSYHVPVMLKECMEYLNVQPGKVFVDGTLGGGGHTHEILKLGGKVIAFDQDPDAIRRSSTLLKQYLENGQLEIHQTNFRNMRHIIRGSQISSTTAFTSSFLSQGSPIDGVLLDLGISSHQIDERSRGFSFGGDGPLDMRMHQGQIPLTTNINTGSSKTENHSSTSATVDTASTSEDVALIHKKLDSEFTAAHILNHWNEEDIADLLFYYGDERFSRRLARAIVHARPLYRTSQLEKVLSGQVSFKERPKTLARCFQALRIRVNDELGALEESLQYMHECIKPDGRLVIMSYHSLEDRRVKHYLKHGAEALALTCVSSFVNENSSDNNSKRKSISSKAANNIEAAATTTAEQDVWHVLTKRAIIPTDAEQETNRRSRSAKLRCAERVSAMHEKDGVPHSKDENQQIHKNHSKKQRKFTNTTTVSTKSGASRTLGAKELRKLQERGLLD